MAYLYLLFSFRVNCTYWLNSRPERTVKKIYNLENHSKSALTLALRPMMLTPFMIKSLRPLEGIVIDPLPIDHLHKSGHSMLEWRYTY